MAPEDERYCLECDIVRLRQTQEQTLDVLRTLFEVIEAYSAAWYRQEHQELAGAALAVKSRRSLS
jgi:hypothetical protein